MKKGGQFYLLGAIIIIVLIAGYATVSNYVLRKSSVRIYDVKDELGIESGKVVEHGVYGGDKTADFIAAYEKYAGDEREIWFIVGDYQDEVITLFTYDFEESGDVGVIVGETNIGQTIYQEKINDYDISQFMRKEGNKKFIDITIGEETDAIKYEFELKPGQNFFFIIQQEIEGGTYVATS